MKSGKLKTLELLVKRLRLSWHFSCMNFKVKSKLMYINVPFRVEYVDSFGRSKMCLRKDLPQMKEKDGKVKLKSLEERWASILLYIFMPIVRTKKNKIVLFLSFL